MKFTINYHKKDLAHGFSLYLQQSKYKWVFRFLGVIFLLLGLLILLSGDLLGLVNTFLGIAFIFDTFFMAWFFTWLSWRLNRFFRTPVSFTFSKTGVTQESKFFETKYTWQAYLKYKHNEKTLILYLSPRMLNIIPRHAVPAKEWNSLLELVSENVPSK